MSNINFTKENNIFLINTNFESPNILKLQGIKPSFFFDNLSGNNYIELNINNEAVAPFFHKLATLVENFDNTTNNQLYIGLFFVELDSTDLGGVEKAPLLLLPINITSEPELFKLKLDPNLNIITNPFLENYLSLNGVMLPDFSEFKTLNDYIDVVNGICDAKNYLLKALSILGFTEIALDPSHIEIKKASEQVETQGIDFIDNQFNANTSMESESFSNTTDELFLENTLDNSFVQESFVEEINDISTEVESYCAISELVSQETNVKKFAKVSTTQKENQLSSLQIHPLTKTEKDILFNVKNGESFKITKNIKSNTLPMLSNLILVSLVQNKKVLYLSDDQNSIRALQKQIKRDGFENFVLAVDETEILNDSKGLFDNINMEATFDINELNLLIENKKTLRLELNEYLKTNHKVFEHMNLTLFDVVQKIISLKEEKNIKSTYPIYVSNITEFSPLDLHRYTFHLNSYVKYFEASKVALENTFWKNIDFATAQKTDLVKIEGTLGELVTIVEHLKTEDNTIVSTAIGYNPADVKQFYNLYSNLNTEIFSTAYVYNIDHESILASLNKLVTLQNSFSEYKSEIFEVFDNDIFSSDILLLNNKLNKNIDELTSALGSESYKSTDELIKNLDKIHNETKTALDLVTNAFNIGESLSNYFSLSNCKTIHELKLLVEMFSFALEDVKINDMWFDEIERANFINNTQTASKLQESLKLIMERISTSYREDIFNVDYEALNKQLSLAKDTETDPVATKIYRYLKSYKKDLSTEVTFEEASRLIKDLKDYSQKSESFNALVAKMVSIYNKPFTIDSDFGLARKNVNIFDETLVAFDYDMPLSIRNFLVNPTSVPDIYEEFKTLSELIVNQIPSLQDFLSLQDLSKENLINTLNNIVTQTDEASYIYNKISSYIKKDIDNITISKIAEMSNKIADLMAIQDDFENIFEATSKKAPELLTNASIDLKAITAEIEVFYQLRRLLSKFEVAEEDFYDFSVTIRQEILSNTQRYNYLIDEALDLFKIVFEFANDRVEVCQNFDNDLTFIKKLQSDFELAKHGFKFARSKEECEKLELTSFLQRVDEDNLEANKIIDAFLVSFYTEWLKETLAKSDLQDTADYLDIHAKMKDYFEVSEKIYHYNKSALYASISEKMPKLTTNKSSFDEVNSLLQEIKPNNETNFKSIFNKIPNLIFEIKPCLITTFKDFKELKTYNQLHFDLVIVDDATKVAGNLSDQNICSKQVVVLGDLTAEAVEDNFFTTPTNKLADTKLFAIQRKFNHNLTKFLNSNYFNKSLFIPYTKNFDLDFKNEFVEGEIKDKVNEVEANKIIELLKDYFSDDKRKKHKAQVVAFTKEQELFITSLISADENLNKLQQSDALYVTTVEDIKLTETNLTVLSLCATDFEALSNFTGSTSTLDNLVTILLNTVNSLYIVESLSLLSKLSDESWNETIKLLFKLVQQFVSTDEMYEIELQRNVDLFTRDMVDHFSTDFNINFTTKNQYNNVYISQENKIKLLMQTDPFINNKTDFDDIYLKQYFTEIIDGVKIVNVLGYSWYLSDDYKTFIHTEIENKLDQVKTTKDELLLKPIALQEESGNFFNLVPYEQADLYEIEPVNDITVFVANAITHIVRVESPIHVDLVHEKLISILGFSNSTFNLDEIVGYAFKAYLENIVIVKDDFYWNASNLVTQPRVPTNVATTRYISHIANEELSVILYEIIKKSYGIRFDSLVTACCKELGFTTQSITIKNKITLAYEQLIKRNKIVNVNNKLKAI